MFPNTKFISSPFPSVVEPLKILSTTDGIYIKVIKIQVDGRQKHDAFLQYKK